MTGTLHSGGVRSALPADPTLLQAGVEASGGSVVVAVLVFFGLVVAAGLALLIAYEAYKGYRGSGDRAMLFLAAGIVLLTAGPIALRVALATFTAVPDPVRILSTTTSELLGLVCILYAIYGRP